MAAVEAEVEEEVEAREVEMGQVTGRDTEVGKAMEVEVEGVGAAVEVEVEEEVVAAAVVEEEGLEDQGMDLDMGRVTDQVMDEVTMKNHHEHSMITLRIFL